MENVTYQELVKLYPSSKPLDLVKVLGFKKSLCVAYEMLNNEEWAWSVQEYATNMLKEIRRKFPRKWNSSWRYDGFLGYACYITFDYEERYAALKRAFDRANPKPPQLLVALAGCYWQPGKPPITEREAESLIKEAIQATPYIEGFERLRGLYKSIGKIEEQKRCERILEDIEKTGVRLPDLNTIPEVE